MKATIFRRCRSASPLNYYDFNNAGGVSLLNFAPDKKELALFESVSREQQINYSLKLNKDTDKLYLCFQGQSTEKIQVAMKDYVIKCNQQKSIQAKRAITKNKVEEERKEISSKSLDIKDKNKSKEIEK